MKRLLLTSIVLILLVACTQSGETPAAQNPGPHNIIVMISDGCGFEHVRATGYFLNGEDGQLVFEGFPVKLAVSTWSLNSEPWDATWSTVDSTALLEHPTDSAASGTALSTGVKTWNRYLGIDGWRRPLRHLSEIAWEQQRAVGLVTTVVMPHATPASFVVHHHNRTEYTYLADWILRESRLRVLMGCGLPMSLAKDSLNLVDRDFRYAGGRETWDAVTGGVAMADCDNDDEADPWTVITHRQSFVDLATGEAPKRLLGACYGGKTTQAYRDGDPDAAPFVVPFTPDVPTLAEMSRAALNVLDDDPDGFMLQIEGGSVDKASHSNLLGRMIEENIDFIDAVQAVIEWVEANSSWDETLLVVTADHECGGLWGPGTVCSGDTVDLKPVENRGKGVEPGVVWLSGDHSNIPVPLYAKGAGAEMFLEAADETDKMYGPLLDNTELARTLHDLWGGWEQPAPLSLQPPLPDNMSKGY